MDVPNGRTVALGEERHLGTLAGRVTGRARLEDMLPVVVVAITSKEAEGRDVEAIDFTDLVKVGDAVVVRLYSIRYNVRGSAMFQNVAVIV